MWEGEGPDSNFFDHQKNTCGYYTDEWFKLNLEQFSNPFSIIAISETWFNCLKLVMSYIINYTWEKMCLSVVCIEFQAQALSLLQIV